MLNKFKLIILLVILSACKSNPTEVIDETPIQSETKPNILLIIADDLGKDAMPNFSEGLIKPQTPNLNSLMNSGITFDNFWSYPVCTPTRASILTGKYGIKTNVIEVGDVISTNETSLQQYIKNNGSDYASAIIGKWHLSNNAQDPITMGVDYYAGILNGGVPSYTNWNLTENGSTSNTTEYTTSKLVDLSADWVGNQTKPWFLWLAFNAPHTPFHLAPTNLHSQGNLPTDQNSIDANPLPYYMSAIEAMDSEIGRLLNSLSTEERNNTVIIFIGDNGSPGQVVQTPYQRQRAKGSLFQGGINVPLFVSGYGVNRVGDRENALVQSSDLFATIAQIAGSSTSSINNSTSFMDLFTSSTNANQNTFVYAEAIDNTGAVGYTIRNLKHKLIKYNNGTERFYDLENDPYEGTNLLNSSLTVDQQNALNILEAEATSIRN
ncbi:MAG: sulfatase-like hydrolase/transferase [Polaribacter sp.]